VGSGILSSKAKMKSKRYKRRDGTLAQDTHTYECKECNRRFEINQSRQNYQTMEVNGKSDKKIPGLFAAGDTITARKPYRIDRLSGLSNATTTGYKGAISAGNYLKSL
jgi:thioredoxin reductase